MSNLGKMPTMTSVDFVIYVAKVRLQWHNTVPRNKTKNIIMFPLNLRVKTIDLKRYQKCFCYCTIIIIICYYINNQKYDPISCAKITADVTFI